MIVAPPTERALFVAWQHPTTRRYYTVGRLVFGAGSCGDLYEFTYTHGATEAVREGFEPFAAFPADPHTLDEVFLSRELPPFFANRLMSRSRPDYRQHLQRLALSPETATAFEILSRSGGGRATDAIEVFPLPIAVEQQGSDDGLCYETHFLLHGFRHLALHEQQRVLTLQPGEQLRCRPEPENPADANAMLLETTDHVRAGWLPRYLAPDAQQLNQWCGYIDVLAVQVNLPPAPTSQRLLCRMRACWPPGLEPFSDEAFIPIPSRATRLASATGISMP